MEAKRLVEQVHQLLRVPILVVHCNLLLTPMTISTPAPAGTGPREPCRALPTLLARLRRPRPRRRPQPAANDHSSEASSSSSQALSTRCPFLICLTVVLGYAL